MTILGKVNHLVGSKANDLEDSRVEDPNTPVAMEAKASDNKEYGAGYPGEANEVNGHGEETLDESAQSGVRKIEAVTLTWSKASLATVLIL